MPSSNWVWSIQFLEFSLQVWRRLGSSSTLKYSLQMLLIAYLVDGALHEVQKRLDQSHLLYLHLGGRVQKSVFLGLSVGVAYQKRIQTILLDNISMLFLTKYWIYNLFFPKYLVDFDYICSSSHLGTRNEIPHWKSFTFAHSISKHCNHAAPPNKWGQWSPIVTAMSTKVFLLFGLVVVPGFSSFSTELHTCIDLGSPVMCFTILYAPFDTKTCR